MAQSPSLRRPPQSDVIAAPISAFESETQAVILRTSPYSEHGVLHVIALMVALALILMAVVKLDRVVQGDGRILPSAGPLFVRPLDKAIVTSISVRTGDVVRKGQVLATLDPTFAAADLKDIQQKRLSAQALVDRLRAEMAGKPYVADPSSPDSVLQASIYAQRQAEYRQSINDFDSRIGSQSAIVRKGLEDARAYAQRRSLAAELETQQLTLQQKGFGSRARVVAATDARVEADRMALESQNEAAQARHDLSSVAAQRAVYISKWRDDLSTQLVQAQNELTEAIQNADKASRTNDLTRLVAPADAVVLKIGKASIGSVIDTSSTGDSEPLFTLTPLGGDLEAEVDVDAKDVGFIRPGDTVRVKLDAYKFTSHGTARGRIKTVSEGAFTQDENGQPKAPYYKVRVVLTEVKLRNVPRNFRLIPGMTLQGDVVIGKRTILSYLLEGALRTGSEAMREP